MEERRPHRGITMHRLPVGGDFPGLLFAVGSMLIFLLAIPALWYIVVGALIVGLVVAAALTLAHNKPDDFARLSFKAALQEPPSAAKSDLIASNDRKSRLPLDLRSLRVLHPSL